MHPIVVTRSAVNLRQFFDDQSFVDYTKACPLGAMFVFILRQTPCCTIAIRGRHRMILLPYKHRGRIQRLVRTQTRLRYGVNYVFDATPRAHAHRWESCSRNLAWPMPLFGQHLSLHLHLRKRILQIPVTMWVIKSLKFQLCVRFLSTRYLQDAINSVSLGWWMEIIYWCSSLCCFAGRPTPQTQCV